MSVINDNPLIPLELFVRKSSLSAEAENSFLSTIHEETVHTMPQPYNSLLIHDSTMTPALEKFHNCVGRLRVHHQSCTDNVITRWITMHKYTRDATGDLTLDRSSGYDTMEFACIIIYLDNLPQELHSDLIAGSIPLGTLLHKHNVQQECRPRYFFHMDLEHDNILANLLEISSRVKDTVSTSPISEQTPLIPCGESSWRCYGRCNTIYASAGAVIAQVVELLP